MTKFEKNQKPEVFVNAGRKAYSLLIPISGCLYTAKRFRDLWTAGYKTAEREARYKRAIITNAEARA